MGPSRIRAVHITPERSGVAEDSNSADGDETTERFRQILCAVVGGVFDLPAVLGGGAVDAWVNAILSGWLLTSS